MVNEEAFLKITELIEKKMGKYKKPFSRNTMLEKDLGITGDDAAELIFEYSKVLNVNVSNFDIRFYFEPEGDNILPFIIRSLRGQKSVKLKELTIGDLEKGVISGKLDETVISS